MPLGAKGGKTIIFMAGQGLKYNVDIVRTTGIPMTKIGVERKIGSLIMKMFTGKK